MIPTDEDFRAYGTTGAARAFPLSDAACAIKAEFNGIAPGKMPAPMRYAPNAYCLNWWNWLAEEKAQGRPVYSCEHPKRLRLMPSDKISNSAGNCAKKRPPEREATGV